MYIAIDLKSFYASVECVERGLNPLTTNLVVADKSRTTKTICLAVSPSLKAYGLPGRARLFEVVQKAQELGFTYITATPRMALYIKYSAQIYGIYLKYIAPEDIHVYSIDEVFMDVGKYAKIYRLTPEQLARKIMAEILQATGITATAGIGTNLYLAKVAMDIVAKHAPADKNGARLAYLNEENYRKLLWSHQPLTDFWRVGTGYAKKLQLHGIYTMGDIARCSLGKEQDFFNEDLLYKLFGVNAELLIDHAWGYEPCTIEEIKAYKPAAKSLCTGQVLQEPYAYTKGKLIVREMTDLLVLDLVEKKLVTNQIVLTVGYDIANLQEGTLGRSYNGPMHRDHYGRLVPEHAHGTCNLPTPTSSTAFILEAVMQLYEKIVHKDLLIRRINITAHNLEPLSVVNTTKPKQLNLFADLADAAILPQAQEVDREKEKKRQWAIVKLKKRFGKNAILRGMNLEEGAMTKERNQQIGGHKA